MTGETQQLVELLEAQNKRLGAMHETLIQSLRVAERLDKRVEELEREQRARQPSEPCGWNDWRAEERASQDEMIAELKKARARMAELTPPEPAKGKRR